MTRFNSILLAIFLFLNAFIASAQEEKKSVKLDLDYSQINNQLPELKATAKSKMGKKKFEAIEGAEVQFFLGEQSEQGLLGKAKTNRKGIASIEIPVAVAAKLDSLSPFKVVAFVAETAKFEEQTTETEVTRARIDLTLIEADSNRKVGAKLLVLKEGKWIEAPGVEMKLFVRRLLSDLPIGESAIVNTDDAGDVSADLNMTIPGDAKGNIIVGAKLDDNETYGTIVALKVARWGIPQKEDRSFYERSLWAARDKTPIWLLVFPNFIIVTVWGLIFYMFFLIYRIRQVGLEK